MTAATESSEQSDQSAFETALAHNLRRRHLLPAPASTNPRTLVIGVSGGADSVALLYAMAGLSTMMNLDIHVAHVDHALRPESHAEADFVRRQCERLGCDFHPHRLTPGQLLDQPGGIEAAARAARYSFLCQVANNVTHAGEVPVLATAHHADDQAETLLLHLVRGSGLRGLAGMRWRSEVTAAAFDPQAGTARPIRLIRPLLNLRRETIRTYLVQQGLTWCDDASNEDTAYVRNYLRHEVVPKLVQVNPQVVAALNRTAEIVADDVERLNALDQQQLSQLLCEPVRLSDEHTTVVRVVLDLDGLTALSRAVQRGVLRASIAMVARPIDEFGFEVVERLLDQLPTLTGNSGPHPLAANIFWSSLSMEHGEQQMLSLHTEKALPIFSSAGPQLGDDWQPTALVVGKPLAVGGWRLTVEEVAVVDLPADWRENRPWEAWMDGDTIDSPTLATPSKGMCIAPLGMGGRTKSVGDLFTDAKVHPSLRPGWPLVVDAADGRVIWVCGQRFAHGGRITERTNRVLHLVWAKQPDTDKTTRAVTVGHD